MSISGLGTSGAAYVAVSTKSQDEIAAIEAVATTAATQAQPSTTVTLGDGTISEVAVYSGKLSSMPMSVAAAPQLFVQGDKDHDNSLSLEEFTDQLKRVGVSSDAAARLFDSLNVAKGAKLSLDDFVKGVAATNADGDSVFQELYISYSSDQDGKFDPGIFNAFMAQGANVAAQYWSEHPELQSRA